MDVMSCALTRRDLEEAPGEVLRGSGWRAGLWRATLNGREVLIKDVRSSTPLFRRTIGRFLIRQEGSIYERLKGCDFVPRFLGWLDADAFVLEWVPGSNLGVCQPLRVEFYDRLLACIRRLHARGVVHLDLRSRRNILVTTDGRPMLVDFGNAMFVGRSWLSRRLLVPLLGCIDRSATVKYRHCEFPETLSRADRAWYVVFRCWRFLWPFGRLWRALGLNHAGRPRYRRIARTLPLIPARRAGLGET